MTMFNQTDINGVPYETGDWKKYTVHNDTEIKGFFGEYRWLSNFHESPVMYDRILYPSVENAYQAAKVQPDCRFDFTTMTAYESKQKWESYPKIDEDKYGWDERKLEVMAACIFDKFYRDIELRGMLYSTMTKHLEETNHWGDVFWGVDHRKGRGRNKLGHILMATRDYWNKLKFGYPNPKDNDFFFEKK